MEPWFTNKKFIASLILIIVSLAASLTWISISNSSKCECKESDEYLNHIIWYPRYLLPIAISSFLSLFLIFQKMSLSRCDSDKKQGVYRVLNVLKVLKNSLKLISCSWCPWKLLEISLNFKIALENIFNIFGAPIVSW